MSGAAAVHQLVHGYVHGHSLLVSSTALHRKDADLIARLSDLSGTLGPDLDPNPYLSLYPLPSGTFYAVAKTWPDPEAPRAGCVLTHTLLVPSETWAEAVYPKNVASLLRRPNRRALQDFSAPITLTPGEETREAVEEPFGMSFVQKYFGQGLTPLAWFGAKDPDRTTWSIVRCLWPKLRVAFACCTYALQPRTLEERPFDLAFVPTLAFSRFGDFPRDQIIDGRTAPEVKPADGWLEPWYSEIFGGESTALGEVRVLARELEAEPTAIRRVFFYGDLRSRALVSPTAALGGLDVLETLAPRLDACVEEKQLLASLALRDIKKVAPADSLERLYLLSERLEKPAFASVRDFNEVISDIVRNAVIADPSEAIDQADALTERQPESSPAGFMAGVCGGLLEALRRKPEAVGCVLKHPTLGGRLIRDCPGLAEAALRASTPANRGSVDDMVLEWFRAQRSESVRAALRAEVLPALRDKEDAALLDESLRGLQPREVAVVCESVARSEAFDDEVLNSTVASALSATSREQVKEWAASHEWQSPRVPALVAETYSLDEAGVHRVLEDYATDASKQQAVLVAFIRRVSKYSPPLWLERVLAADSGVWTVLLARPYSSRTGDVVSRLVRRLRRSAIAQSDDAVDMVGRFAAAHRDDVIRDHAIRQAWADYLEGASTDDRLCGWMQAPWVREWLVRAPRGTLRSEFANALTGSREAWMRAWHLLASLPESTCVDNCTVVHDGIGILLQKCEPWEREATDSWQTVLRRIAYGDTVQVDLCAQALNFGFEHRSWPVEDIVAEAFFAVHDVAMRDEPRQRSFLFWTVRDWDKAMELRRTLVDAFYYGNWRRSRFVLAGREPWLIRKLCKRMMRHYRGEAYLEDAYDELLKETSPSVRPIAATLREILRAPGYQEDWD